MQAPPNWLPYVSVPNADKGFALATSSGASTGCLRWTCRVAAASPVCSIRLAPRSRSTHAGRSAARGQGARQSQGQAQGQGQSQGESQGGQAKPAAKKKVEGKPRRRRPRQSRQEIAQGRAEEEGAREEGQGEESQGQEEEVRSAGGRSEGTSGSHQGRDWHIAGTQLAWAPGRAEKVQGRSRKAADGAAR